MKTRNYIYIVAALMFAAAFVSCQKEIAPVEKEAQNENTTQEFGPTVFTLEASMSNTTDTKVALEGLAVKWTAGDQIVVNGVTSKPLAAANIKASGGAVFEFASLIEGDDYYGVYPASAYVADTWDAANPGEGVRADLKKVQTYTADSFDPGACILIGKGTDTGISFHHAMTYMKLTFDKNVKSVAVMANNGQRVRGQMGVDFTGKSLTNYYPTSDFLKLTLDGGAGITAGDPVIIALPNKNFSSGLNLFVVTDDDQYQVLKTSALDLSAKRGVIITKAASLASLKTYQGPGIYNEYDWNSFVSAYESAYTTDLTQKADHSDFVGTDGEVNIYESFTVEGNLTRLGCNIAGRDGVVVSGSAVAFFTAVLDGNNNTITQTASMTPIITYLGTETENGTIKNLTLAGNCTSFANGGWGNAAFVIRSYRGALIKSCTNQINTTYTETEPSSTSLYLSGFVVSNGGLIEDCVNEGNMEITLYSSGNRDFVIAGFAVTNSREGKCGDFTRCTNKGNIKVVKTSDDGTGPWCLRNCGIAGICGYHTLGAPGEKWAGNYTYYDCCKNEGNITFWEDKAGTATGNQLQVSVGGILGFSTKISSGSSCPDFTADGNGYYFIIQEGYNTGTLDVSSGNTLQPLANSMSGARQTYIGGLVGLAQGGNEEGKGNSTLNYPVVRGRNDGIIKLGGTGGSECAGGIIGGAGFVRFEYLFDSNTKFEVTANPAVTSNKIGGVAALAGWVMKRCIVFGQPEQYTLKMDATGLNGQTIFAQGVCGITSAKSMGAAGTWGTSGSPLIIFENPSANKIYSAVKKDDGSEIPAGEVSTESGKTNGCFYGGGAAYGKGLMRTTGNLTMVAY